MQHKFFCSSTIVAGILIFISGCGGGSSNSSSATSIGGLTVGHVNAAVKVVDNGGTTVSSAISDDSTRYTTVIPAGSAYPLLVEAGSGIDLVTGVPSPYRMLSAVMAPGSTTVNFSPFSVLIVKTALLMNGGLTADNLQTAAKYVLRQLNFGLDTRLAGNPIATPITEDNIVEISYASALMEEMIRRVQAHMQLAAAYFTQDELFDQLAADLVDGRLDGRGVTGANQVVSVVVSIISAQVLMEYLAGNAHDGFALRSALIDNAIRIMSWGSTKSHRDLVLPEALLFQMMTALGVAQAIAPSQDLSMFSMMVSGLKPEARLADEASGLAQLTSLSLDEAIARVQSPGQNEMDKALKTFDYMSRERTWSSTLSLAWLPNPDDTKGYIVYYGPTSATASKMVSDMPATSIQIDMEKDLNLRKGDKACFKLAAYNVYGQSPESAAVCMTY